jgi:hypothetical protein
MSIAQRYAGFLERESHNAATPTKGAAMRQSAKKLIELDRENERLRADAARLDWLADPNNGIGNVQLPTHCVISNMHSLRDAIDMAMREQEHDEA